MNDFMVCRARVTQDRVPKEVILLAKLLKFVHVATNLENGKFGTLF